MSSEQLGSGVNILKGDLAASFDILSGSAADYQDLGIARRFGGAAAAYSLRDIGAMNGPVVKVRRDMDDPDGSTNDPEVDFSASQIDAGVLEDWVNGKLETTLPADVATAAAAYSLRKVKGSYAEDVVRVRRIDNTEVDVAFDSDGKVSANSSITNITSGDVDNTAETTLGNFLQGEANVRAMFNNSEYFGVKETNWWSLQNNEIQLGSDPFTISCDFVCTDSFGNNQSRIAQSYDGQDFFQFTTSTQFQYKIDSGESQAINFSPALQLGRKYSFEVSRDSSDHVTLKIDGVTMGTNAVTSQNSGDCHIGRIGTFRLLGAVNNYNFNNGEHIIAGDGTEASNWADTGSVGGKSPTKIGSSHTLFTGQGMDSFVHTWYDQAGSNDAVQTSSANQPKIAENGALITENNNTAIDFEESSSQFLLISKAFANSSGADVSIFSVSKNVATAGNNAHPIISNRSGATNGYQFGYDGTDHLEFVHFANTANGAVSTQTFERQILGSAIRDNLTFDIFGNAVNKGDNTASGYVASTDFTRIGGNENASKFMDGTMQEIVIFESDQTDNRFKIESNINNYYGLYNDENEASDVFQGVNYTVTDATKTGFTIDIVTATGVGTLPLVNAPDANETIYVSYNLTINSGSPSINVVTQDRSGATNTTSADFIITEAGFYSHAITPTQDGATHLSFADDADNVNFTISDLKVSRIARNGFVETLYDQSGNSRDVSQDTAGNQPTIVSNGGIYKTGNYPSIRFTASNDTYLVTDSYSPVEQGGSGMPNFTLFTITGTPEVIDFQSIVSAGSAEGSNTIGGFKLRHRIDGDNLIDSRIDIAQAGANPHLGFITSVNATPNSVNLLTTYLDSSDDELFVQQNTATSGTNTTTLIPLSGQGAENDNLKIGTNMYTNNPRASYLGEVLEVILYTDSKKSDLSDLKNDINNFYNI